MLNKLIVIFFFALAALQVGAQGLGESGQPLQPNQPFKETPRDSPWDKKILKEKRVLEYDHIEERDVMWSKRIWRVIDVREKMNLPFAYSKAPLVKLLIESGEQGEIDLYSSMDDEFKHRLEEEELSSMLYSRDSLWVVDPVTYKETLTVVENDFNYEDVKRFRVKEDWFFDTQTSTMKVRILGIAPLKEVFDDNGNFKYEIPMFWVYYPDARQTLSHAAPFMENQSTNMSWEDLFEMRYFSSYVYKESNVYNRRIQDYKTGLDALYEGEAIKTEIFNFEHDLWSY